MTDPECGKCRFWLERSDDAREMGGGYCRRYPPSFQSGLKVFEVLGRVVRADALFELRGDDQFLNDGWPYVTQQSWCGEFSPTPTREGGEYD